MTEGEFPFRSFTMRSEGYDRNEVDSYVAEMQREIVELRRALDTATPSGEGRSDTRLHDPEGAVTRTLAIAQETADRVLHDAQVEADRRRADADEHATGVIADADERAARLLGDMEAQAAEVREQGVAAARSAIQVERDKAMAELAHVRRVRDDLRNEAVDLKSSLDRYRSQAREASDTLAAASSGPLMGLDLPDFVDDDVVLAGIGPAVDDDPDYELEIQEETDDGGAGSAYLRAVTDADEPDASATWADDANNDTAASSGDLAEVIAIDGDQHVVDTDDEGPVLYDDAEAPEPDPDPVERTDADNSPQDPTPSDPSSKDKAPKDKAPKDPSSKDPSSKDKTPENDGGFSGTFLAEVRAAAEDDHVALPAENEDSDRFLSELRGIAEDSGDDLDSDAADTFFEDR